MGARARSSRCGRAASGCRESCRIRARTFRSIPTLGWSGPRAASAIARARSWWPRRPGLPLVSRRSRRGCSGRWRRWGGWPVAASVIARRVPAGTGRLRLPQVQQGSRRGCSGQGRHRGGMGPYAASSTARARSSKGWSRRAARVPAGRRHRSPAMRRSRVAGQVRHARPRWPVAVSAMWQQHRPAWPRRRDASTSAHGGQKVSVTVSGSFGDPSTDPLLTGRLPGLRGGTDV